MIAADAAAVEVRDDLDRGVVRIGAPIAAGAVSSVHVDDTDAARRSRAAAEAITAADLGDPQAQDLVDDAEGFELSWYASQEIAGAARLALRPTSRRGTIGAMDAITNPPEPVNEPIRTYAPGSPERATLAAHARRTRRKPRRADDDHRRRAADGRRRPHRRRRAAPARARARPDSAGDRSRCRPKRSTRRSLRRRAWRELSFDERAAVFLRAADLLSGPWRDRINAATMLGQSKTVQQAEIDSACELADFLRFNVHFARQLLEQQPISSPGVWNRMEYRPLEGFVVAITPFNFTAIAGNLPSAPALLGNVVVWKPSPTQQLAAHYTMRLFEAAGLPAGVINLVTGDGAAISSVALTHRQLAGVHFTGSTATFQHIWRSVGEHIDGYAGYPRLVGETGGKDFVVAHPSADPATLVTGLVRGAFEYQGQKCSAASRAYIPRSLWDGGVRDDLAATTESLSYGDVTDFSNFGAAVIDRRAFARLDSAQERLHSPTASRVRRRQG